MPSEKGVAELLAIMRRGEFYSSEDAAKTLARLGKLAVPALKEACSFPGYAIAAFANEALESIDDPEAGPALVQAVREGFPGAILSLGKMEAQAAESVPLLLHMLTNDPSFYKRGLAAEALGELQVEEAIAHLIHLLEAEPLEKDQRIKEELPGSTISFTGKRFYSDLREILRRIATPRALDWLEAHKANERKKGGHS